MSEKGKALEFILGIFSIERNSGQAAFSPAQIIVF